MYGLFTLYIRTFCSFCRHYCDLKHWEQPTINSLGQDGIPPPRSAGQQAAAMFAEHSAVAAEAAMERAAPSLTGEGDEGTQEDNGIGGLGGIEVTLDAAAI